VRFVSFRAATSRSLTLLFSASMTIGAIRRFAAHRLRGLRHRRTGTRGDTEYLLSSPENARRLLAAIEDSRAGKGTRFATIDDLRRELGF
jgi:hypothetical protein